ncbi:MAG: hypothetical protein EA397_16930 [Deltaproteobacteria bacterium]|nr:MAG: hypothetical protein EA397_16930 [Deltaproteobacteria bacterium]
MSMRSLFLLGCLFALISPVLAQADAPPADGEAGTTTDRTQDSLFRQNESLRVSIRRTHQEILRRREALDDVRLSLHEAHHGPKSRQRLEQSRHRPSTSPWRPSRNPPPELSYRQARLGAKAAKGAPSPHALVLKFLGEPRALPKEHRAEPGGFDVFTLDVTGEDRAIATLSSRGQPDDSVGGGDTRLILRKHQGAWYIQTREGRTYCSRGISKSGVCL